MSTPLKLDGVRIQTARMLEIYSLLRQELEGANKIVMPADERSRLQRAVDTIAANMAQFPPRRKLLPPRTRTEASTTPASAASILPRRRNSRKSSTKCSSGTPN